MIFYATGSLKADDIMEILILVSKITNRLFYIIELIFKEELGINFKFTTDKEKHWSNTL